MEEQRESEVGLPPEAANNEPNVAAPENLQRTEAAPKSNKTIFWVLGGVLLFVLFGCAVTFIPATFLYVLRDSSPVTQSVQPGEAKKTDATTVVLPSPRVVVATPEGGIDYQTAVLNSIYNQVNPSVVNVSVLARADNLGLGELPFNADPGDLLDVSSGSGFVWDSFGNIITNDHVVQGADEVQITFADGTVSVAEIVGVDDDTDLAVVRVDPAGYTLAPIALGNMDDVTVGMRVVAIGNAFGLNGTMTTGIVSAIGRSIGSLNGFSIPDSIQTDAAINPGNSGGPLLNERGELIGVNAQIRSDVRANSGVGFAIPVSIVKRVVPALIEDGKYTHSYMGISGGTLSPICANELGLPLELRGALVGQVRSGTPADKAGIRGSDQEINTNYPNICPQYTGGDVITSIGDMPVTTFDDMLSYLVRYTSPGDSVPVTIWRDGETQVVEMTLAERPANTME